MVALCFALCNRLRAKAAASRPERSTQRWIESKRRGYFRRALSRVLRHAEGGLDGSIGLHRREHPH